MWICYFQNKNININKVGSEHITINRLASQHNFTWTRFFFPIYLEIKYKYRGVIELFYLSRGSIQVVLWLLWSMKKYFPSKSIACSHPSGRGISPCPLWDIFHLRFLVWDVFSHIVGVHLDLMLINIWRHVTWVNQ